MRRIFVYEYFSGGGAYSGADSTDSRAVLAGEGAAMAAALACDLRAIPGIQAVCLRDARLQDARLHDVPWPGGSTVNVSSAAREREAFEELAARCDGTVIIAPERDGALLTRTRWAEDVQARLLCPNSPFVAVASDKNRTAEQLWRHGVPVPTGRAFSTGDPLPTEFPYPAVLKPADGAGSIGIQRLDGPASRYDATRLGPVARLEALCPGLAASVVVLCGPDVRQTLPPCRQRLSSDGTFRYLGGAAPLETHLAQRAQRLALAALACLPPTQGYVGVDLVLGDADDGASDVVIEVNPRLTTSYLGLRRLLKTNLAAAMIAAATGQSVELRFARQAVEFTVAGGESDEWVGV